MQKVGTNTPKAVSFTSRSHLQKSFSKCKYKTKTNKTRLDKRYGADATVKNTLPKKSACGNWQRENAYIMPLKVGHIASFLH